MCSLREWFPSRRRPRYRWRTPLEPVTRSRQPSPLPFSAGSRCPMPINWRWKSRLCMYPERCHAGIAGGLERKAGIDFSLFFHIFRYLCSSAILNQRKVKMRQHNLRILFFLLVLWGVAVAAPARARSVSAFPNVKEWDEWRRQMNSEIPAVSISTRMWRWTSVLPSTM